MNTTPQYKNICLAQQQKDQLYFIQNLHYRLFLNN
jgi:hypothetical protein